MKCDVCINKDSFDECPWPKLGCCSECSCKDCDICEKPVKAMYKIIFEKEVHLTKASKEIPNDQNN